MADALDKKAEIMLLSPQEITLKHYINERLARMLREEEIKWYQRAKVKDLLQGDSNTKYFHLVANGKHRKKRIYKLEHEGQIITGDAALKQHITSYYKDLFGKPDQSKFSF